jgi:hypothetical protein
MSHDIACRITALPPSPHRLDCGFAIPRHLVSIASARLRHPTQAALQHDERIFGIVLSYFIAYALELVRQDSDENMGGSNPDSSYRVVPKRNKQ